MPTTNDDNITSGYYTTTQQVINEAGLEKQDDIKIRYINDAIKAVTAFINGAAQRTTNYPAPIAADLELAATKIAAGWVIQQLQDSDKDYMDFVNLGMMILANFLKTDPTALTNLWGTFVVSAGRTSPFNPNADPFMSSVPDSKIFF